VEQSNAKHALSLGIICLIDLVKVMVVKVIRSGGLCKV
jgi:hypothetical protein